MTKKTKNLLYGKLKGGFSGLMAVLLLSCSLIFVSCEEEEEEESSPDPVIPFIEGRDSHS